ncbi:MAG: TMEM165/GDT1 family protein [Bdellovibrio sp.]
MESVLNSFLLVAVSEIGDKTQLLSLILAARYKKPIPIILGIFIATILNHGLASYIGEFVFTHIPANLHSWILGIAFIGFGFWILIPDKEEEIDEKENRGAFLATLVLFFLAEMGDKTQLATIALGGKYLDTVSVSIGSTFGMLAANIPAVFMGDKILKIVPLKYIRWGASALFILFGLWILIFKS